MKFVRYNDKCWHAYDSNVDVTGLQKGFVRVDGEVMDMNDEDGMDCSVGTVYFDGGFPLWNANATGNASMGISEDLRSDDLREIADFMDNLAKGVVKASDVIFPESATERARRKMNAELSELGL